MQRPKTSTTTFAQQPQTVFDAVRAVVQDGSYDVVSTDDAQHLVTFTSGKTAISWGHEYAAQVVPLANGGSELQLVCGGVDGRPQALMDGWKNGKAGAKLVSAVQAALPDA